MQGTASTLCACRLRATRTATYSHNRIPVTGSLIGRERDGFTESDIMDITQGSKRQTADGLLRTPLSLEGLLFPAPECSELLCMCTTVGLREGIRGRS